MFVLTKREQRVVVVIVFLLIAIALVKYYRDPGTIAPAPSPEPSAIPTNVGN